MSNGNPLYMDYGSLKNQGIYSGDGNKYRFGFQVWSSAKLLDNPPELDDGVYYCFSVREIELVDSPSLPKYRCWIKKDMLEQITTKGHFSIFYDTGMFLFFYGQEDVEQQELVGLITYPLTGLNGKWGADSIETNTSLSDIWTEETISGIRSLRKNYLSLGHVEKLAHLFTGRLDTTTDSLSKVVWEPQLNYTNQIVGRRDIYSLVIKLTDNIVQSIHLGIPNTFRITKTGLPFALQTEEIENGAFRLVAFQSVDGQNYASQSSFVPHNSTPISNVEPIQYDILVLNELNQIEDHTSIHPLSRLMDKYNVELISTIGLGQTLTLYIQFSKSPDEVVGVTGTLMHSLNGLPSDDNIKYLCKVIRTEQNEFFIFEPSSFFHTITTDGIKLEVPNDFNGGNNEPIDPNDFEEGLVNPNGTIDIDLNSANTQDSIKIGTKVSDLNNKEHFLPANFINARYPVSGSSMGVVRLSESSSTNTLNVALDGVTEPPASSDKNHVYGYNKNNSWGLFEFEDVELVQPEEGGSPKYQLKFIKDAEDMETAFYDGNIPNPKWVKNSTMLWRKHLVEENVGGNLVLDYKDYPTRLWDSLMPGIVMIHPDTTSPAGLFMNIENNGGPRLDLGWGGANGGNFELYSTDHTERSGQFRVIFGPNGFIEFKKYISGETWKTVAGITKEGRFFCGFNDTGFPGTSEASIANDSLDSPAHPLQVYNESDIEPKVVGYISKEGALCLSCPTGSASPSQLLENSFVIWQDEDTHDILISIHDGTDVKDYTVLPYMPTENTLADKDIIVYDEENEIYTNKPIQEFLPDGENENDILIWEPGTEPVGEDPGTPGKWKTGPNESSPIAPGTTDGQLLQWDSTGGDDGHGAWLPVEVVEKNIVTGIEFTEGKLKVTTEDIFVLPKTGDTTVVTDVFDTVEGAGAVMAGNDPHTHA